MGSAANVFIINKSKNGGFMAKKQPAFPGMEPPTIKEIEEAAEDYEEKRDQRMEHTKREVSAAAHLLNMLEKHKLLEYRFDGKKAFVIQGGRKVKVRTIKDDTEAGDDGKEAHTQKTVKEIALATTPAVVPGPTSQFDQMVVGEIVEASNQTMDWWNQLPPARKDFLYGKQLASPPRRKGGPRVAVH
jgi:hypothetical protein